MIFQELLFESNLVGDDGSIVPYQEVVEETSNLLISNEAAVGLGNTVFSASWLTELFSIAGVSEFSSWKAMISHLFKVLLDGVNGFCLDSKSHSLYRRSGLDSRQKPVC